MVEAFDIAEAELSAIGAGFGPLEPRRLQGKDLFTALRIVHGTKGELRRLVTDMAAAQAEGGAFKFDVDVALTLAFALMELADGPIREWLADLANLDADAFDDADLLNDIVPFLIALYQREDWAAFLERVRGLLGSQRAIKIASSTATGGRTRSSKGSR